jgi:hypothetical protein
LVIIQIIHISPFCPIISIGCFRFIVYTPSISRKNGSVCRPRDKHGYKPKLRNDFMNE